MTDTSFFHFVGTIMGLIFAGVAFNLYLNIYQKILSLKSFTVLQKRTLVFQLYAISLFTIVGLGIFFDAIWSDFDTGIFDKSPGIIILGVLNWILLGFIAVTSIFSGVSIISSIRSWNLREPAKEQEAFFTGVIILALLIFWTWNIFLPRLQL